MRIGIVTDSCCDLPRPFLDEHKIVILPITIQGSGATFIDTRDPAATQAFFERQTVAGAADFESVPYSSDQIRELFLSRLVVEFDYVFCLTVMGSRSLIHQNAMQASLAILNNYRPIREQAGLTKPFSLRVFDSRNLFPGQGLIVAELARMAAADATTSDLIRHVERLTQHTQAFLVPADLGQLRHQARRKGDKSVGLLSYALGSALDIKPVVRGYRGETAPVGRVRGFDAGVDKLIDLTTREMEHGLVAPTVCLSYGGNPAAVQNMPAYQRLMLAAKQHGVSVHLCEMSTTAAVNIGAGGLAIAFASEREAVVD